MLSAGAIRAWCVGKTLSGTAFDASDPADIQRLSASLGFAGAIRQAPQVHGDRIDLGENADACDAFLVRAGQAALVRHADCFPVVVAAPSAHLAIVAHCGWKGVVLDLAGKSVRQLQALGVQASDLSASIGPGIGPASFEVGPEVIARFPTAYHRTTAWGTPSVDLPLLLMHQLERAGVATGKVQTAPQDTFTDPRFHSHRREQHSAGRNATVCIVSQDPSQPENQT
jgi:polyphenol oxidase